MIIKLVKSTSLEAIGHIFILCLDVFVFVFVFVYA